MKFIYTIFSALLFTLSLALRGAEITILHTTDTHGRLNVSDEVAAIFDAERTENTIVIDCGDLIQGTYNATLDRGKMAVETLNKLNYDVWVVGNHDLEFGADIFFARASEFQGATLGANWRLENKEIQKWKMFDKSGIKIAVIGLTREDQNQRSYHPDYQLETESDRSALIKILPLIKSAGAEIIILARHSGNYDKSGNLWYLASEFPDIDLVLGGHTHQTEPGTNSSEVFYAQAGKHASCLGVVKISFDEKSRKISQIAGKLTSLPVETGELLDNTAKIGKLETRVVLPARKSLQNMLAAIGAEAMKNSTDADVSIFGTRAKNFEFPATVTEYTLFKMFPYEDEVLTITVDRKTLTQILQEQIDFYRKESYSPYVTGVSLMVDNDWQIMAMLPEKSEYRVALSSFAAVGGNGKFAVLSDLTDYQRTGKLVRESAGEYIKKSKNITPVKWLTEKR